MQTRANTQNVNDSGSPFGAGPPSAHAPASGDDIFALLERLGALREAGVLTDDEFESKKTELLGRL